LITQVVDPLIGFRHRSLSPKKQPEVLIITESVGNQDQVKNIGTPRKSFTLGL
jgi:hypothetical protein